ncbi:hypothetical protein FBUS_06160 [Fasciolopsis buskii]|uniref:Uncharacterized protein n=1 Tax=Fasciolopsis buskii TaxID=27845 RepID=A0A8E0RZH7_9TREM|nr:hypothetical protein FBUS_06160 [Fasciolopsis buski]
MQSSAYQAYPIHSSYKPASPEFAWHNHPPQQLQQNRRLVYTHTHPKKGYLKSSRNSSILDSVPQFRTPGGSGGKFYDLSPNSVNGNSDHSPAGLPACVVCCGRRRYVIYIKIRSLVFCCSCCGSHCERANSRLPSLFLLIQHRIVRRRVCDLFQRERLPGRSS